MSVLFRTPALIALAATASGLMGATPAPRPAQSSTLTVDLTCVYAGRGRLDCQALPYGGTEPYSYAWSPTPIAGGGSGGLALIGCNVGQYRTVTVTVTDATSATATTSSSFYCG